MLAPVSSANIANAASIKSHGSETRTTGGEQAIESHLDLPEGQSAHALPTIGLSGSTALASVDAVKATAGTRTVLQLLAYAVAAQLNLSRRPDETLEAFFLRIATTIKSMKDADRAALEIRSGLRALNIRLSDLADALMRPEGTIAARIVALAEAPKTSFVRAAAAAATSTYLQEGLATPRSVETFSIEAAVRSAEDGRTVSATADARGLQNQLQQMFEPGITSPEMRVEARGPETVENPESPALAEPAVSEGLPETAALDEAAADTGMDTSQAAQGPEPELEADVTSNAGIVDLLSENAGLVPEPHSDAVSASTAVADPALVAGDLNAAETEALLFSAPDAVSLAEEEAIEPASPKRMDNTADAKRADAGMAEKGQLADRRLETLFVLKGLAEAALAGSAEPDHIVTQPDPTDPFRRRAMEESPRAIAGEALARIEKAVAAATAALEKYNSELPREAVDEEPAAEKNARTSAPSGDASPAQRPASAEMQQAAARTVFQPDYVPFAYAPLQPGKEEFEARETEGRGRGEDDESDEEDAGDGETPEQRRERLARKETDDLLSAEPEETASIPIDRDSSESDRAYAMYQRLGGF